MTRKNISQIIFLLNHVGRSVVGNRAVHLSLKSYLEYLWALKVEYINMFGDETSFNRLLLKLRSVEVVKYLFSEMRTVILPALEQLLAQPNKAKFGRNILLVLLLLLSKMRSRETKELLLHLVNRIAKNDNILGCDIAEAVE